MAEKKKDQGVTYLLRNVPEGVYREAQRLAKKRGLTLRTQILLLLEEFVNAQTTSSGEEENSY